MNKKQPPSYPWYPSDFAGSAKVAVMTLEQEGAYRRLLDHEWQEGAIPDDVEALARICRTTAQHMEKLWKTVRKCFTKNPAEPDTLINQKLEKVRAEKLKFQAKNQANGAKGGRPKNNPDGNRDETQTKTQTKPKNNPTNNPKLTHSETQSLTETISQKNPSHISFPISLSQGSEDFSNIQNLARPEERDPGAGRAILGTPSKVPEEKRRAIWAPVEAGLRRDVEPESFARYYAGCELVDLTAKEVVLAVPIALIQRNQNSPGLTARILQPRLGDEVLRGRILRVIPLEQPS